MIKYLRIILLLTLISPVIAQTDPNIHQLHPYPQGEQITWIKMWDDNNWYMGGDLGKFMKTSDAGLSWKMTNMAGWPNPNYPGTFANNITQAAWFFDKNVGIVGGQGSGIARTTDAGNTWNVIPVIPANGRINAFSFINNNIGFLVGNANYRVMKTTDGGLTWAHTPAPLPASTGYSIYASDADNLIVFGASGAVYISNDAGNNWITNTIGSAGTIQASAFVNHNVGYVCGSNGLFSSTSDGGYSWSTRSISGKLTTFYAMKVLNNEIYLIGNADSLFKSTDNGSTWIKSSTSVPAQGQIYSASMYAIDKVASTLVIGGLYGLSFKSPDNGASWDLLDQFVSVASSVNDLYVENTKGKIIAQGHGYGAPGAIFYSTNGGVKWQQSPYAPPVHNILHSKFLDNNNGWFVGENAYLAKTQNGGISLDTIILNRPNIDPLNTMFNNLHFINPDLGWIVGGWSFNAGPGIIYKTTDGGATWIDQSMGNNNQITAIDFADENIGYAEGNVILVKTTDGGTTWTNFGPSAPVPGPNGGIQVLDKNFVYLNTGVNIFRTVDGGITWTQIQIPFYLPSIDGMQWQGDFGVCTSVLGTVVKTTNGGQDWSLMNTGGKNTYGINIISPDTFYIGGGDGQVFIYTNGSTPVELSSLLANSDGYNVSLRWSTASEKNNYGFGVERSSDRKSWNNISFIKGAGTSIEKINYSYDDINLSPGTYYYRLKEIDLNGNYKYYNFSSEILIGTPKAFELSQNYPNPFNPSSIIKYAIPQDGKVTLKLYNVTGKELAVLVNEYKKAGNYSFDFNARFLPSGVYFYKLESGIYSAVKKLSLIK